MPQGNLNCSNSGLLKLPIEIRRIILHMLLWDVESTCVDDWARKYCTQRDHLHVGDHQRCRSIHSMNAQVLLVCKQLNDEGSQILYHENRFKLLHWPGSSCWLAPQVALAAVSEPLKILQKFCVNIRKLEVTVWINGRVRIGLASTRRDVRALSRALRAHPCWSDVIIRCDDLLVPNVVPAHECPYAGIPNVSHSTCLTCSAPKRTVDTDNVLRPLSYLRGFDKVEIKGTRSSTYGTQLAELMMSHRPCLDLPAMWDRLVHSFKVDGFYIETVPEASTSGFWQFHASMLRSAMDRHSPRSFLAARKALLLDLYKSGTARRLKLLGDSDEKALETFEDSDDHVRVLEGREDLE